MMPINFDDLLKLYRNTVFSQDSGNDKLRIANADDLALIQRIDNSDNARQDAGVTFLGDPANFKVGDEIEVEFASPRIGLGVLAENFNGLLRYPGALIREPEAYFIKDIRADHTAPQLDNYRKILHLIHKLSESAAYLDVNRQELVFIHDGKFTIPIKYNDEQLSEVSIADCDEFIKLFVDSTHLDQKLAILTDVVVNLTGGVPDKEKFRYMLRNLDQVVENVRQGYRIYASEFSVAKIRGALETARLEYVSKIHKTITDIQGQLLGIPVATVIVASQLKAVDECGAGFWSNLAILIGAWVFVVLLGIAVWNQWMTLIDLDENIAKQKGRLLRDYMAAGEQFQDIYDKLLNRVFYHQIALAIIGLIGILVVAVATIAFWNLTHVSFSECGGSVLELFAELTDQTESSFPPAQYGPPRPTN